MHPYELMVILDPGIDERTVAPSMEKFLGVIRNAGGGIVNVYIWGQRRLAAEVERVARQGAVRVAAGCRKVGRVDRGGRQVGHARDRNIH